MLEKHFFQVFSFIPVTDISFNPLSAVEVLADELHDGLGIVGDVATQGAVVESAELGNDTINHSGAKDTMLLEGSSLPR
jgi:hypothetical protein